MRVAVLGAAGAVGAAVVDALRADPRKRVDAVVGLTRRLPSDPATDVEWVTLDPATSNLAPHLRGVDALVDVTHGRDTARPERQTPDTVDRARRVLVAAAGADVHHVVQLSSFLAYASPGDRDVPVDETWPREGLGSVQAARTAVALERALDAFAKEHEVVRLVRIRSGVILGPRVRRQALGRIGLLGLVLRVAGRSPIVPGPQDLAVPVVHHDDLAAAVSAAVTGPALGAYNVALDVPMTLDEVAQALGARPVVVPGALLQRGGALADRLAARLARSRQLEESAPVSAWLELLTHAPRLDTRRARQELEWTPRHTVGDSVRSTFTTA